MLNPVFDHMDTQDSYPAAYDDNGTEIWPGEETVNYEGKDIVWETFIDKIISLLKPGGIPNKSGALTLARALDLEITRHE